MSRLQGMSAANSTLYPPAHACGQVGASTGTATMGVVEPLVVAVQPDGGLLAGMGDERLGVGLAHRHVEPDAHRAGPLTVVDDGVEVGREERGVRGPAAPRPTTPATVAAATAAARPASRRRAAPGPPWLFVLFVGFMVMSLLPRRGAARVASHLTLWRDAGVTADGTAYHPTSGRSPTPCNMSRRRSCEAQGASPTREPAAGRRRPTPAPAAMPTAWRGPRSRSAGSGSTSTALRSTRPASSRCSGSAGGARCRLPAGLTAPRAPRRRAGLPRG